MKRRIVDPQSHVSDIARLSARTRSTRGSWSGCSGSAGFSTTRTGRRSISVFPLAREPSSVSAIPQLGLLGSAFMLVYALTSPFTGYTVDRLSRRLLITVGSGILEPDLRGHGLVEEFRPAGLLSRGRGPGRVVLLPGVDVGPGRLPRTAHAFARDEHSSDQRVSGNGRRGGPGGLPG